MIKFSIISATVLVLALSVGSGLAAPLAQSGQDIGVAADDMSTAPATPATTFAPSRGVLRTIQDLSNVEEVHGCHRRCRIGPATGILHRHVGPNCRWVRC